MEAAAVSHIEMARHLGLPEPLRRRRQRVSPPCGGDTVRVVNRGKCTLDPHGQHSYAPPAGAAQAAGRVQSRTVSNEEPRIR